MIALHLDELLYFEPLEDLYRERKDEKVGVKAKSELLNDENC